MRSRNPFVVFFLTVFVGLSVFWGLIERFQDHRSPEESLIGGLMYGAVMGMLMTACQAFTQSWRRARVKDEEREAEAHAEWLLRIAVEEQREAEARAALLRRMRQHSSI